MERPGGGSRGGELICCSHGSRLMERFCVFFFSLLQFLGNVMGSEVEDSPAARSASPACDARVSAGTAATDNGGRRDLLSCPLTRDPCWTGVALALPRQPGASAACGQGAGKGQVRTGTGSAPPAHAAALGIHRRLAGRPLWAQVSGHRLRPQVTRSPAALRKERR